VRGAAALLLLAVLPGCTTWLFSDPTLLPDRTRPVAKIETKGGVEYGAATTEGVLFLGRTAQAGPCRIHYYLGRTPVTEDGTILPLGGVLWVADVDTKQQQTPLLGRELTKDDHLVAILYRLPDVATIPVVLARGDGLEGDLLEAPATPLPVGTGIFVRDPETEALRFAGLVSGVATVKKGEAERRLVVFAGTSAMRVALATPTPWPEPVTIKHRPDDIVLTKKRAEIR
jgi:hypothetical protein